MAPFNAIVTAVRWTAVAVGIVLAASGPTDSPTVLMAGVLIAYALFRTIVPLEFVEGRRRDLALILGEAAVVTAFVATSGQWESPLVVALVTPIVAAGFARGFVLAIQLAVVEGAVVAASLHIGSSRPLRSTVSWMAELALVAIVAGYGRKVSSEMARREQRALGEMSRLSEANDLLLNLHRLAQTLPASLDLAETAGSTVARAGELFGSDAVALLLYDDLADRWSTAGARGTRLPSLIDPDDLPPLLRRAADATEPVVADLGRQQAALTANAASGMYAPLRARQELIGLLALERRDPYQAAEVDLLTGLAEQAAVALDNARWFGRLRRVGADEERLRIARDLHDRVGQSLAYLAFSLDRLAEKAEREPVHEDLDALRVDVRGVVSEVRETLYDLRTGVSDDQGLVVTLGSFLDRVRTRSGIDVRFEPRGDRRLPLPVEREMWRIAQEAVTNAERHARATTISVSWACDDERAELIVRDDGRGLSGHAARTDAYGLIGIRERADAIGALLDISSSEHKGTTVRCWLTEESGER